MSGRVSERVFLCVCVCVVSSIFEKHDHYRGECRAL